jgi:hypothetical protein
VLDLPRRVAALHGEAREADVRIRGAVPRSALTAATSAVR